MWIKEGFLILLGLASGCGIAGGLFALIVKLGILPRLASWTKTSNDMKIYEDCILVGGTVGNIFSVFSYYPSFGIIGLVLQGLFYGIYIGCLYMALAEALHVIPVLMRRLGVKQGAGSITFSMAVGKAVGAFLFFYYNLGKS